MKWNLDSKWFTRGVALFFAILLFSFVYYEEESRNLSTNPTDGASITGSEVIANMPIDINVDREQYFVSGIPETATIRLEGPQAILTQTLATQNFSIVTPDLNELGPGTHEVQLEAEGLSNQLDYSISPSEFTLTVEQKQVEEFEVRAEFNESAHLAEGYTAGEPVLSEEIVTVSGAESTMEQISDVMVVVAPEESDITEDIQLTLNVLVLNASGDPLNVNIDPQQIEVTVPVEGTQRTVPIVLKKTGTGNDAYDYNLEFSQGQPENVTVTGETDALEALNNFSVDVDISGITESTIRTVPLTLPEGITGTDPEELEVLIRVSPNEEETSGDNSAE
ncbi:CdaR family protein [Marinilactibacillus piezotolerans]|uniref:CdaR family protein n=1 Tax=Marinilactibacillus piezotolerans TaxID=258723 RepID=UPI0009B1A43C|nr:CdaR family protein [Marinilactibacillus piezotolerans]